MNQFLESYEAPPCINSIDCKVEKEVEEWYRKQRTTRDLVLERALRNPHGTVARLVREVAPELLTHAAEQRLIESFPPPPVILGGREE